MFINYIINSNCNFIIYNEGSSYIFININNIRKFNGTLNGKLIQYIDNNELVYLKSIFFLNNKVLELNLKTKLKFIKESFFGNKGKLKIVGRGWKIIKYSYELLIKLGFSHMIFLYINPLLKNKFKKKKKKYYIFYSVFSNELDVLLNKIKLMRIPDYYTRKGIFYNKSIF